MLIKSLIAMIIVGNLISEPDLSGGKSKVVSKLKSILGAILFLLNALLTLDLTNS